MSVILKRSESLHIPRECPYGCCTVLYGKSVPIIRRRAKRAEKQAWKRATKEEA